MASWSSIAFAQRLEPGRRACRTRRRWHYVHTRPVALRPRASPTTTQCRRPARIACRRATRWTCKCSAVRNGWLPFYPAVRREPARAGAQAEAAGAKTTDEIVHWRRGAACRRGKTAVRRRGPRRAGELAAGLVHLARQRAHGERQGARVLPASTTSARTTTPIADEIGQGSGQGGRLARARRRSGKMDLVVDLNFRMDTSALYSDIVLPAATWYEKDDLNTTDMHSFIHPLAAAVPPCWESKSDWEIFSALAKKVSELAPRALPRAGPGSRRRAACARHAGGDRPAAASRTGSAASASRSPARRCRTCTVVERDYANLYNRFISLGPQVRENGLGAHGTQYAGRRRLRRVRCRRTPTDAGDGQTLSVARRGRATSAT